MGSDICCAATSTPLEKELKPLNVPEVSKSKGQKKQVPKQIKNLQMNSSRSGGSMVDCKNPPKLKYFKNERSLSH